jgi:hypothetical protein
MKVAVSDHALLRHIERVVGVNLDALRDHIRATVQEAADAGATSVTVDGATYCIVRRADGTAAVVTTVLLPGMRHGRRR